MADRKISDLTALTTPASGDYLPIVDISEAAAASKNKRITIEELMRGMPDGTAAAPSIAFESDPNTGIYSPGADQLAISTNGTGRLFVDSSGRVGIGTSSPGAQFMAYGASGTAISLNNASTGTTSTSGFQLQTGAGGDAYIWNYSNSFIALATNNTERLRIDSSGRVGIGTTTPGSPLDVFGGGIRSTDSAGNARSRFEVFTNGQTNNQITLGQGFGGPTDNVGYLYNRANAALVFGTNDAERMRLTSAGLLGLGTSAPQEIIHANGNIRLTNGAGFTTANSLVAKVGAFAGSANQFDLAQIGFLTQAFSNNGQISFSTSNASTGNLTEALRIDSSQRVGIGTSSPGVALDVVGGISGNAFNATSTPALFGSSGGAVLYYNGGGVGVVRAYSDGVGAAGALTFNASGSENARIDSSGRLLVGTSSDSGGALLQVNDNRIRIATANTPASAGATGTTGEIAWDASYIYVCTATNTWKRTAISTW